MLVLELSNEIIWLSYLPIVNRCASKRSMLPMKRRRQWQDILCFFTTLRVVSRRKGDSKTNDVFFVIEWP